MLDKRFRLDDLLVTAVEVDRRGPESPVEVHLLDDAASALARIERDPALEPRDKGRALEVLAGTVCILAGAWLLAAALGPGVRVARLPGLDAAGLGRVAGGADSTFEALADEGASDTRPATGQDALIGVRTAVPPPPPQPGSAGTDSHTPLPPPPPLPLGAVMTLQAPGASGAGAAAGPGGTLAQGDAPDDAVVGGGGAPGGGSAGGGLPTDHREVVRRYFSQP
jgi:hypothetical protein